MAAVLDTSTKVMSPNTEKPNDLLKMCLQTKTALVSPNAEEYDALISVLKDRIEEGNGETIFNVGDTPEGGAGLTAEDFEASVATLKSIADTLDASCVKLRQRNVDNGITAQYLVRKQAPERDFTEIRVAVVGNVDAGKSTLLGVLTHGELDNGRGYARQKLFRHKHEMESGRTSSVGNDILGFDYQGNVVNKVDHGALDWVHICEKSSKVITFIDLAGHERYLKTTVFGMTGHAPHFGMLMVGSNAGIVGMTKEHLGLALALSVPVFVVITKIDMCPANVLQETLQLLVKVLKSPGCRKVPVIVKSPDDVVLSATNFVSERLCPVFQVSNVSGENLDLLKMFMNLLTTRSPCSENDMAEFQIDDTYSVPGVGTVVSGTTLKGTINLNDILLLGPDALGHFQPIAIKSIHRKRMPVAQVRGGQTASFALKKIKRSQIRKGMVLVSPSLNPTACWEFEGEILVLHHPTTISTRYQAMVHCGSIRQTASILSMSQDCLRTGDKATVHFRFIKHPEYLNLNQRLVFREGRTKAVGNVTKLIPLVSQISGPLGVKNKGVKHNQGQKSNQQQKQIQNVKPQNDENALPNSNDPQDLENGKLIKTSSSRRHTKPIVGTGGEGDLHFGVLVMEATAEMLRILNKFICSVCFQTPSPPIYNCAKGHLTICGICLHQRGIQLETCWVCLEPFRMLRDRLHEQLIARVNFPCEYRSQGCQTLVPGQIFQSHVLQCEFREIRCQLRGCFSTLSFDSYPEHMRERHFIEDCRIQREAFYVGHSFRNVGKDREYTWKGMLIKMENQEFYTRSFMLQGNLYLFLMIFAGANVARQYQVQIKVQGVQGEENESQILMSPVFPVRTTKIQLIENYPLHYRLDENQLREITMSQIKQDDRLDFRVEYKISQNVHNV
ncbi:unnamed protein product [Allacma fusca]|uniref:GTP-binding protein 1 n=1 Tax=Allacma fusca TaxID=39272 RepID=A0A8J2K6C5_9HEXA|nr:unnamed protein product [Allacma fusca]